MSALANWRLCPTFSIVQAAFLFCGRDPSHIKRHTEDQEKFQPQGYVPVRTSLLNAVVANLLPAQVRYESYEDGPSTEIDIHTTQIAKRDLDNFFDLGDVEGYFFGETHNSGRASGATAKMPPKLNAALRAWTAVTSDSRLTRGKSPKQALKDWLVEHAAELGLHKPDGQINKAGIAEICKVANWKPEGGATRTPEPLPDRSQPPPPRPPTIEQEARESFAYAADLDDEIPF